MRNIQVLKGISNYRKKITLKAANVKKAISNKEIEEHLLKSEDDILNGRVRDAREVFKEWEEKYGI